MVEVKIYEPGRKRVSWTDMVRPSPSCSNGAEHQEYVEERAAHKAEQNARVPKDVREVVRLSGVRKSDLPNGLQGHRYADGSESHSDDVSLFDLADMLRHVYQLGKQERLGAQA